MNTTSTEAVNNAGNIALGFVNQIGQPLFVIMFLAILAMWGLKIGVSGSAGALRKAGNIIKKR